MTLPRLYKDDEGLYKLRMVTKGGTAEHSAFISVSGKVSWMAGPTVAQVHERLIRGLADLKSIMESVCKEEL